jgi:hypothetical protein
VGTPSIVRVHVCVIDAGRLLGIVEGQSADVEALLDRGGDIASGLADPVR